MVKIASSSDNESELNARLQSEDVDLEDEEEEELEDDDDEQLDLADHLDLPLADDEEVYKLEDPDDIDDDLELRNDSDDAPKRAAAARRPQASTGRETRKRQLTFYEDDEDDEDDEDEEATPNPVVATKSRRPKQTASQDIDPDLILTDEETEYNPGNNVGRMTERQRAKFREEQEGSQFMELRMGPKKPKAVKKETEEEAAVRKAESARKRLHYKNKMLEEEKQDTLNKLLKRRANKTREVQQPDGADDNAKQTLKPRRPQVRHPALFHYQTNTTSMRGTASLSYNV